MAFSYKPLPVDKPRITKSEFSDCWWCESVDGIGVALDPISAYDNWAANAGIVLQEQSALPSQKG